MENFPRPPQPRRHGPWPVLTVLFGLWALVATIFALRDFLWPESVVAPEESVVEAPPAEPPPPPPDQRVLQAASFGELPGWQEDDLAAALAPLRSSCPRLARGKDEELVGPEGFAGTVGQWRAVCEAASAVSATDAAAARAFFEAWFEPWAVLNNEDPVGLFTGYYEPTLRGSRRRGGPFQVPLYRRPRDLVSLDLGLFREELKGQRLAGRVEGGSFIPYANRAEIDSGALSGRGLELVWVDDVTDAFFLHVQGSGRVELEEGGSLRVGYAAQNGHPYVAIGRELADRGEMPIEEVSMQSIRRWLAENPEEAGELMAVNPSYVFFRTLEESGPVGSQGVVLTPGRSLAVDRRFLPLGVPLWLDTEAPPPEIPVPATNGSGAEAATTPAEAQPSAVPLRRLMIAQDTGGAIRGPVRGDVFWGPGDEAASVAGRMKHKGRLWILLPKSAAAAPEEGGTAP